MTEHRVHVVDDEPGKKAWHSSVAIVGAGAAGLISALAAAEKGANVIVLERDATPSGSTALSAGLVPAPATRWQREAGIDDSIDQFVDDIINKSGCVQDEPLARLAATTVTHTLHWLADQHNIPLSLVDGFTYPGHQVRRMHGTPRRTGQELMGALVSAVDAQHNIDVVCNARVDTLFTRPVSEAHTNKSTSDKPVTISGIGFSRPDQQRESISVDALILACNGYGGNRELLGKYIPSMQQALYFGHAGNTGDALLWGQQMNAATGHLGAFQGHGSVARPHGILITWAVMMQGGIQLNQLGQRFSNEHAGYSEQAAIVENQPDALAYNVYDQRIHDMALQFEDYRNAQDGGAIVRADCVQELARVIGANEARVLDTLTQVDGFCDSDVIDEFGRQFNDKQRLSAPYYVVCVEGALFHTQGGLGIDTNARVLNQSGHAFPNLFAAGGAAQGVSGDADSGYLSGNGLLMAVALGAIAGNSAAHCARS